MTWEIAAATVGTLLLLAWVATFRELVRLRERVTWLEAKVNGIGGKGKVG